MEQTQDRRAMGVRRVRVERLVDICDKSLDESAFQATSLDVSGRGMHVRTRFVPELDAPLVLRFQEQDAEIIAEGEVAWRTLTPDGGEFGVRFTALDSDSVCRLKSLCNEAESQAAPEALAHRDDGASSEQTDNDLPPVISSSVKLHLAGLASPMRAEVKEQGYQHLDVGSNLEFLRLGRALEVEEVELGRKRQAEIESVHIAIDPRTQIPQLILSLRYPEAPPSEAVRSSEAPPKVTYAKSLSVARAGADDDEGTPAEGAAEANVPILDGMPQGVRDAFGRAAAIAERAGAGCLRIGAAAGQAGRVVAAGAGRLFQRASVPRRVEGPRRTSPVLRASPRVMLRPQHGGSTGPRSQTAPASATPRETPAKAKPALQRYSLVAAVCASCLAIGLWWSIGMKSRGEPALAKTRPATVRQQQEAPAAQPEPALAATALSAAAPATVREENAAAPAALQPAERAPETAARPKPNAVPVARREAAPIERAPTVAPREAPRRNVEFSRGRLNLPIIHRLRLDNPGQSLSGESTATGFSVFVPGRKLMENGTTIARRDGRIGKVSAKNGGDGARLSFSFHGPIPAYKVRLRGDFVEIFIGGS